MILATLYYVKHDSKNLKQKNLMIFMQGNGMVWEKSSRRRKCLRCMSGVSFRRRRDLSSKTRSFAVY